MLLILVLIIGLTFYSIYDKESIKIIVSSIKDISFYYVIIGILIICMYFILQGIYMKIMLKIFNKDISLKKGSFYSLVEFYFSGITPSSTGGQPVQLYYMTKDKIPVRTSYIVLILNTIYFKIVLLSLAILVLIFKSETIFSNDFIYILFFSLGFLMDLVMVFLGVMLLFNQKLVKRIFTFFYNIGMRFKSIKKRIENKNIEDTLENYKREIKILKKNKKAVFISFIVTFIQRLMLFSIAFVVYKALGFNEYNYFDLLTIQVSVQTAIEALPLPGGACLSENMLQDMFVKIFKSKYADVGMLLTRTFSFYIPLLASGLIILGYTTISKKRKKIVET